MVAAWQSLGMLAALWRAGAASAATAAAATAHRSCLVVPPCHLCVLHVTPSEVSQARRLSATIAPQHRNAGACWAAAAWSSCERWWERVVFLMSGCSGAPVWALTVAVAAAARWNWCFVWYGHHRPMPRTRRQRGWWVSSPRGCSAFSCMLPAGRHHHTMQGACRENSHRCWLLQRLVLCATAGSPGAQPLPTPWRWVPANGWVGAEAPR